MVSYETLLITPEETLDKKKKTILVYFIKTGMYKDSLKKQIWNRWNVRIYLLNRSENGTRLTLHRYFDYISPML